MLVGVDCGYHRIDSHFFRAIMFLNAVYCLKGGLEGFLLIAHVEAC